MKISSTIEKESVFSNIGNGVGQKGVFTSRDASGSNGALKRKSMPSAQIMDFVRVVFNHILYRIGDLSELHWSTVGSLKR